jgi:hypothetical protein
MRTRTYLIFWTALVIGVVLVVVLAGCSSEPKPKRTSDYQLTATANARYNASRSTVSKSKSSGAGGTSSGIPAPPTPALVPTPQPTMTPTQYLIGLATFFRSNWILDSDHAVRVSSHLESLNPPREYLQDHKRLLDVHQLWLYQFMQVEFFDESSALTYGAMSDAVVSCANATDPYAHVDYTIEYKTACNQLSKLRSFVWDEEWFWKDNDAYKQVEEYAQIIR